MQIDKKPLTIRKATIEDAELILEFIKALALYEKLENDVSANKNLILKNLFGENTKAYCLIAEYENEAAGFAIYFYNFSTFLAKPGLYLEDLFVKPEFRAKGIGKALIKELAKIAIEEDLGRIEWWVLDWNTPSIEFYKSLGAIAMDEWTVFRVTADKFKSLACYTQSMFINKICSICKKSLIGFRLENLLPNDS
ncbi:MAG: GNAT family N-acetyltransferase [Candidatus Caenarcaniphilales bacterium]|jgi:GNAT superfamily N-acetyltransferase|nr:GNAT family N-acetyltransferase [Candidatus Caenarcaniphilales bacterium]